jgi:O-succinylbenzoic acid--CoA ligase
MLRRLLEVHAGPYEGLKGVLVGGGPADRSLIERALDAGIPVLSTYGSTETCSQVATVAPGEERASLGTAGRPLSGFEVRIGATGRIEVLGDAVATETIDGPMRARDEWLPMGDIGRFDDEGRLLIEGRADRVIVTGGVNVHPDAIESVLVGHPNIADVHVSGTLHPEWGMAVTAEIVLAEGARFDERAAAAWSRARMPGHQVPKVWSIVDQIDRTELGKHPA